MKCSYCEKEMTVKCLTCGKPICEEHVCAIREGNMAFAGCIDCLKKSQSNAKSNGVEAPEYGRAKEDLAQWLFFRDWDKEFTTGIYFNADWQGLEDHERNQYRKEADQILSRKDIAILADNQNRPNSSEEQGEPEHWEGYEACFEDMIRDKFRRMI